MKISVATLALCASLAWIGSPAMAGHSEQWTLQVQEKTIAFRDTPSDRASCEARLPTWRALNDRWQNESGEKYSVDCVPVGE